MAVDGARTDGASPLGAPARMRRVRQELSLEETLGMLVGHEATSGVLALNDPDLGAPYAVPMSYVFVPGDKGEGEDGRCPEPAPGDPGDCGATCDAGPAAASDSGPDVPSPTAAAEPAGAPSPAILGSVYFHGSPRGRKVELLGADARASFCVVAADEVVQEEFATHYRSVVASGRLEVVCDDAERMRALQLLGHTYSPDLPPSATDDEIAGAFAHVCVLALRVEHASGKQAKALADARRRAG